MVEINEVFPSPCVRAQIEPDHMKDINNMDARMTHKFSGEPIKDTNYKFTDDVSANMPLIRPNFGNPDLRFIVSSQSDSESPTKPDVVAKRLITLRQSLCRTCESFMQNCKGIVIDQKGYGEDSNYYIHYKTRPIKQDPRKKQKYLN